MPLFLKRPLAATLLVLLLFPAAHGMETAMSPRTREGRPVAKTDFFKCDEATPAFSFKPDKSVAVPASGTVYVTVAYLDEGFGKIDVQATGPNGATIKPDRFLGLWRSDTHKIVNANMRIAGLNPAGSFEKAAQVKTRSGKPGELFSSSWPATVDLHFSWMRKHDIDGAFLQRFVHSDNFFSTAGKPEWVLSNVREAAHRNGRLWAVEYDVSGCPDAKVLDTLKTDWKWLCDGFGIRTDANYAHEGNKLVVFIWGQPARPVSAIERFLRPDVHPDPFPPKRAAIACPWRALKAMT